MGDPVVGLIQMEVVEDKKTNLNKAQLLIQKAAQGGANIIVLPEMFNCPYVSSLFPIHAEESGDISWEILSKSAKENNIYLVGGSIPESQEGKIYNTSYIFDPKGNQIGKHQKMHLFDIDVKDGQRFKESDTLTSGEEITLVETEFCKIGIGICYDIRFPEYSRILAMKGADILIFPAAFNMTTGPEHWELSFRMRALDNQVYAVGCSPARNIQANYVSYAHSIIASPWARVVNQLYEKEGVLIQSIDLSLNHKIRKELPLLDHRRLDRYEVKQL